MCKVCEDHDDLFESPLFHPTLHLGFGGDVKIWVYVDAYNQQMSLHMLNQDTGNIIEYHRVCNFCPVCGRDLSKAEE
jgi:non-homologous end joining protein Ku